MINLQAASYDIYLQKYQLRARDGQAVDKDLNATQYRVAEALAANEKDPELWAGKFLWALQNGAIPAGRIIANAGAEQHKPATSTINCTVSGEIGDSMDSILGKVHEAGITLKAGCGIGYEFSTLRPRGSWVSGAGAQTSGPLSFMDVFDSMCFTVSSAGGRRGAQMATFDVSHPDVKEFIEAKREDGRLRQFNMSLLITDAFIGAVKSGADWELCFPVTKSEYAALTTDAAAPRLVSRPYSGPEKYVKESGTNNVICRVYNTVPAAEIWDLIMRSTYDYAEPGFILIDRVNEQNNNWWCEDLRTTNPCGEQPLPPYGSCLLGSLNLAEFVTEESITGRTEFHWHKFDEVVHIFTRMLDNVVELNGLPLQGQRDEITRKRRHGMGFTGLGSAVSMLGMKYGSPEAVAFTSEVSKRLAVEGWAAGLALAKEKGPAPIMSELFTVTPEMLAKRPAMVADGYDVGHTITGKVLLARYSNYMQKIAAVDPATVDGIAEHGSRFTHHSSIAPTGTISLSIGNNVSNGIEPTFSHHYTRNIIRPGKNAKESVDVYSYEALHYRHNHGADAPLPEYFSTTDSVAPKQHVDMQAAAQEWVDSSISKTVNVPSDIPFDEFKDVYLYAHEKGLKGCTTFRYNPEAFSGVLVKVDDLEATVYEFTTETGEKFRAKGNDVITYQGQEQTAANLFDALKEGYFGKF